MTVRVNGVTATSPSSDSRRAAGSEVSVTLTVSGSTRTVELPVTPRLSVAVRRTSRWAGAN